MAGTPWYPYCSGDLSDNFCGAELDFTYGVVWDNPNWCQIPWCYVDPACPTFVSTSVFNETATATTVGYSYQTCGGTDCYSEDGWGLDASGVKSEGNCPWGCNED